MEYDKFTADDLVDVPQPDQALLNMFVRLQEIHDSLTPERIASSVNYDLDRIAFLSQVVQYKVRAAGEEVESAEAASNSEETRDKALRLAFTLRLSLLIDEAAVIAMDVRDRRTRRF